MRAGASGPRGASHHREVGQEEGLEAQQVQGAGERSARRYAAVLQGHGLRRRVGGHGAGGRRGHGVVELHHHLPGARLGAPGARPGQAIVEPPLCSRQADRSP